jgi:hypothetical protein
MGFLDWIKRGRNDGRELPQPEHEPWWDREKQEVREKEGKVVWAGGVYENKEGEAWPWVKKIPDGKFRPGITIFDDSAISGNWATKRTYEQRDNAISEANKTFHRWREVHAPDMKVASPRIQNEVRNACGLPGKDSTPAAKDKGHRWER